MYVAEDLSRNKAACQRRGHTAPRDHVMFAKHRWAEFDRHMGDTWAKHGRVGGEGGSGAVHHNNSNNNNEDDGNVTDTPLCWQKRATEEYGTGCLSFCVKTTKTTANDSLFPQKSVSQAWVHLFKTKMPSPSQFFSLLRKQQSKGKSIYANLSVQRQRKNGLFEIWWGNCNIFSLGTDHWTNDISKLSHKNVETRGPKSPKINKIPGCMLSFQSDDVLR